jgi:hypothetical protein
MIDIERCVVCDGKIRHRRRALVAPFLSERISQREPFCVDLVECVECGFIFYTPRLDDSDLQLLYRDYRSPEYCRMRQSTEPWYTPKFNERLASASSYERRRAALREILLVQLRGHRIKRVLDYGGDRGDLVAGLLDGAHAFVYDISGIAAADGVTAVSDPRASGADLIINSNVLEHIGFPKAMVQQMLEILPADGLLFLEVPSERPFGANRLARRVAQAAWMVAAKPRLAGWVLRPEVLYMMHEHINYYTEATLRTLMTASGGDVVASGQSSSAGPRGRLDMVWCLGKRT